MFLLLFLYTTSTTSSRYIPETKGTFVRPLGKKEMGRQSKEKRCVFPMWASHAADSMGGPVGVEHGDGSDGLKVQRRGAWWRGAEAQGCEREKAASRTPNKEPCHNNSRSEVFDRPIHGCPSISRLEQPLRSNISMESLRTTWRGEA